MATALKNPNTEIFEHATRIIRGASHGCVKVFSVLSAGDSGIDADVVLYVAPGAKLMTAYLTCEQKTTGGMAARKTITHIVAVEEGWD